MRAWTLRLAQSRHIPTALFAIAFIEASFFPIPPDVLLVAVLMISATRWWQYAGIVTAGSVLGALLGYAIGWGFYKTIGVRVADAYNLQEVIRLIGIKFEAHAFLTVFTAAFTLIPFKVITISAGLFKISIWQMVLASIIGRGMRFFAIAYLIKVYGKRINSIVYKYFNIISLAFVALLILAILIYFMVGR